MASLEVVDLHASYGDLRVLSGVTLEVGRAETVAVLGRNAVGKTTLLRAISGVMVDVEGSIRFEGEAIIHLPPHERVARGLVQVPQGRGLFSSMTVRENLILGGYRRRQGRSERLDRVLDVLPELRPLRTKLAGELSGGQQQILAIARALIADPVLLLLDEPSLGLAPVLADRVYEVLERIRDEIGLSVLLVEQEVDQALELADRAYVLDKGTVRIQGEAARLAADPELQEAFMGVSGQAIDTNDD